jgi:hypothetical protein
MVLRALCAYAIAYNGSNWISEIKDPNFSNN